MTERRVLVDNKQDILSHKGRRNRIHILSIDPVLTHDLYKRMRGDDRLKHYRIIRPRAKDIPGAREEIQKRAQETIAARLLILDVRPQVAQCVSRYHWLQSQGFQQALLYDPHR
ncbi:MAG: hypothetical protein ACYTAS_24680 [Planctomycetota bacterium]